MKRTKRVCVACNWRFAVVSKPPQSDGRGRVGISHHSGFAEWNCSASSAAWHCCSVSPARKIEGTKWKISKSFLQVPWKDSWTSKVFWSILGGRLDFFGWRNSGHIGGHQLARVSVTFRMFLWVCWFLLEAVWTHFWFSDLFWKPLGCSSDCGILEKLAATCWPEFRLHFRSCCEVVLAAFWMYFLSYVDVEGDHPDPPPGVQGKP